MKNSISHVFMEIFMHDFLDFSRTSSVLHSMSCSRLKTTLYCVIRMGIVNHKDSVKLFSRASLSSSFIFIKERKSRENTLNMYLYFYILTIIDYI